MNCLNPSLTNAQLVAKFVCRGLIKLPALPEKAPQVIARKPARRVREERAFLPFPALRPLMSSTLYNNRKDYLWWAAAVDKAESGEDGLRERAEFIAVLDEFGRTAF